ncbi:MAG: hypothetical protein WC868_07725 [Bacteroidales bacterium]
MEEQKEIQKQFRQQQEKYTYYIIALCVAAIGFSVHKTIGLPLKWVQIPLGIAVLSWGTSIYCGLKFISYIISTLYANNVYLDIIQGRDPDIRTHPQKIEAATKGIKQAMESNVERASSFSKWQDRLFIIGFIAFLVWHILEMYKNTISIS